MSLVPLLFFFSLFMSFTVFAKELEKPKPPPNLKWCPQATSASLGNNPLLLLWCTAAIAKSKRSLLAGLVEKVRHHEPWGYKSERICSCGTCFYVWTFTWHFGHINKKSPNWKALNLSISFIFVERNMCEFFGTPSLPSSDQRKNIFPIILLHDVERHLFSHSFEVELADSQDHHVVSQQSYLHPSRS